MLYYEEIKQQLKETLKKDFNKMQKTEIEGCIYNLFLTYEQMNSSKKKIQLENLQKRLEREEVLIAYAYGAYISNRMAHLFKDKDFSIKVKNLNQIKTLGNGKGKRELRQCAFANKNMFIKQILEKSKQNSKYRMGWAMDEDGVHILNINVTNYKRKKKGFPKDIVISVHVLDPRLSKVLTSLEKYPRRGSKPDKVFGKYDVENFKER